MQILAAIKSFFSALSGFFKWLGDKQLINAGKAEQQRDDLVEQSDRVQRGNRAKSDTEHVSERRYRD